jgi:uncharacterized protein (TIGR00251 family)
LLTVLAHIPVRLTPRGNRDAIECWRDGVLHVRVAAPPVDGRANDALLRLLAAALRTSRNRLRIVQGDRSRRKLIEVAGMTKDEADDRLRRYESEKSAC